MLFGLNIFFLQEFRNLEKIHDRLVDLIALHAVSYPVYQVCARLVVVKCVCAFTTTKCAQTKTVLISIKSGYVLPVFKKDVTPCNHARIHQFTTSTREHVKFACILFSFKRGFVGLRMRASSRITAILFIVPILFPAQQTGFLPFSHS